METRWRTVRRIFAFSCVAIALILALVAWKLPQFGIRTTFGWERVDGTITQSEIKEMRVAEGVRYKAGIHYVYRVQEREYTNNQVELVDLYASDQSFAQKLIGEFPKGKTITVLYNPESPNQSLIRHRQFLELLVFIAVPILLLGFGFWLWRWDL
jgi:4-amino-4-deoxy-L-arabinose transferase-like glycosyltransferase